MENGIHNGSFLFNVINKLSLICRTNIQLTTVGNNLSTFFIVKISAKNISNGYFVQLYIHILFPPYDYSKIRTLSVNT